MVSNYSCTQVIAPYLIILRVAKRRAMTSEWISGNVETIRFRSQGLVGGGGFLPDRNSNATEVDVEDPGEPRAGNKDVIVEVPL